MNRRISPSFQVSFPFLEYHWTMEVPSAQKRVDVKQPKPNLRKMPQMPHSEKTNKCLFATCKHPQLPVRIALPEEPHCFLQRHHNMIQYAQHRSWIEKMSIAFEFVFLYLRLIFSMIVFWIVAHIICVTLGGVVYEHSSDHNCVNC